MPRAAAKDTIGRQWQLLHELANNRYGLTTRELRDRLADAGFVVDLRTVQRDLNGVLSRLFMLECVEDAGEARWRFGRLPDLATAGLNIAACMTHLLLGRYLGTLLPRSLRSALLPWQEAAERKLSTLAPGNRWASWLDLIASRPTELALQPPEIDEGMVTTVQEALATGHQLDVHYRGVADETPRELRLHPLGLVQSGPVTYLIATAFEYSDVRRYALHRITSAARRDQLSARSDSFSLSAWLDNPASGFGALGDRIQVELRVDEHLARVLSETPLGRDMVIEAAADGARVTASVSNDWALRWWLLSRCGQLEVLAPADLRTEIAQTLRQAADRYSE